MNVVFFMDNRSKIVNAGFDKAVVLENPDYDEAIVGVTVEGNVVYDFRKMIEYLQENYGLNEEQAVDFIATNTMRVIPFAADRAPIIITMLNDLEG